MDYRPHTRIKKMGISQLRQNKETRKENKAKGKSEGLDSRGLNRKERAILTRIKYSGWL